MPNPHIGDQRVSIVLGDDTIRALRRHQADALRYGGKRPPIAELCRNAINAYYAPDRSTEG